MKIALLPLCVIILACSSTSPGPAPARSEAPENPVEAISLTGRPLHRPGFAPDVLARRTEDLATAEQTLAQAPGDADALIWVGRRLAYLGRYRDAIDTFTRGVELHPGDARMFRHRGHRFITVRQLDRAVADLSRAASLVEGRPDEVEPDGMPNARGIPTSTLQSNVFYHLGLARYLRGDFEAALDAYRQGMRVSKNPDGLVSMSYWHYLTLRRLGRHDEAAALLGPITPDLDVIENGSYYRLLQLYRGERTVDELLSGTEEALDDATTGYGVGALLMIEGEDERAKEIFRRIVASDEWAAFGYIAAEAEFAR
jgi:tetratricopeptide (TPR) repeat protein